MKKCLFFSLLSLFVISCDRPNTPPNQPPPKEPISELEVDHDNTARNAQDLDEDKTPLSQGENKDDLTITQKIRQALIADGSLSINGKNIKVITLNGVVTLRGPVDSDSEKANIENKVKGVKGIIKIDNQLDVIGKNNQ